jgi:hypothetical protein
MKEINGHLVPSRPLDPLAGSGPLGVGGGAGPGVSAPGSAGLPVQATETSVSALPSSTVPATPVPQVPPTPTPAPSFIQPPPMYPWPPNPWVWVKPSFGVSGPGNFYPESFGQCTWWALRVLASEGYSTVHMENLGTTRYWAADASARGLAVVGTPIPDSTVVFQPDVEGAGGGGHVAHVMVVYPDGWFLIEEMNFYWNGGGWGRVDYRYAHSGWGVQFIVHPS